MTTQKQLVGSLKNTNKMGRTINEQLNIPTIQPGQSLYQPQLYGNELNDEKEYDYPMRAGGVYTSNFSGADGKYGWDNCGGCSSFSNAIGDALLVYPTCVGKTKIPCQQCKTECKDTKMLGWRQGGKACFNTCYDSKLAVIATTAVDSAGLPIGDGLRDVGGNIIPNTVSPSDTKIPIDQFAKGSSIKGTSSTVMSTGTIVGVSVVGISVVGLAIWYFKFRKKAAK